MIAPRPLLSLTCLLLGGTVLAAQDLSPRMGFGVFYTQPSDSSSQIYTSGWSVALTIHVRREHPIEGRLRLEAGGFSSGDEVDSGYAIRNYAARTRLVGYDWLFPLGNKSHQGLDFILGVGGAHWYVDETIRNPQVGPAATYTTTDTYLAFAGTAGFRYRFSRHFEAEIHHVFTSVPRSDREFSDAELSHTAFGLTLRF